MISHGMYKCKLTNLILFAGHNQVISFPEILSEIDVTCNPTLDESFEKTQKEIKIG